MLRCTILSVLIVGGLGAAMSATTSTTSAPYIVGGTRADIRDHPYQLSLQAHLCGASIINERWAVTAAHCVQPPASMYRLRAGNSDKDLGTFYVVTNLIVHPNYNALTKDYDIALLQIEGRFDFNENVRPIPLAENDLPVGIAVNVTGWGATAEGGEPSRNLMRVSVPIVDKQICQNIYKGKADITDRMVCAGYAEGEKDACQGDSGGPMETNNILYGVVSWGYGCARRNYPGIYTSVANLRQWITDNIGN